MTARSARHLANAVSLLRPALGLAVLLFVPRSDSVLLLPVVLIACASDWIDGQLARRADGQSRSGRIVDNLCDFFFLMLVFVFLAEARAWSPPVWDRLVRNWEGANWLPAIALALSFGVYFVRMCREMSAGREPARSPRGHTAGIANYGLVIAGAVEVLPRVNLGPWLLEPAMVSVALLNFVAVFENLRLMFHRPDDEPRMPA